MVDTPESNDKQMVLLPDLAEAFTARSSRVTVARGLIIVGHTDDANDVFLIESGTAQVSLLASDGKELILREIGAGEMFGEMSAIDGRPRSATVIAKSSMILRKVDAAGFSQWLEEAPGAGLWIARLLVSRMRQLTDRTFQLSTMTVTRRIHIEILRMAEGLPAAGNTVTIANFPTHADFAARIGSHREAVSRELGWLRSDKVVSTQPRSLTILDIAKLQSIANR